MKCHNKNSQLLTLSSVVDGEGAPVEEDAWDWENTAIGGGWGWGRVTKRMMNLKGCCWEWEMFWEKTVGAQVNIESSRWRWDGKIPSDTPFYRHGGHKSQGSHSCSKYAPLLLKAHTHTFLPQGCQAQSGTRNCDSLSLRSAWLQEGCPPPEEQQVWSTCWLQESSGDLLWIMGHGPRWRLHFWAEALETSSQQ